MCAPCSCSAAHFHAPFPRPLFRLRANRLHCNAARSAGSAVPPALMARLFIRERACLRFYSGLRQNQLIRKLAQRGTGDNDASQRFPQNIDVVARRDLKGNSLWLFNWLWGATECFSFRFCFFFRSKWRPRVTSFKCMTGKGMVCSTGLKRFVVFPVSLNEHSEIFSKQLKTETRNSSTWRFHCLLRIFLYLGDCDDLCGIFWKLNTAVVPHD